MDIRKLLIAAALAVGLGGCATYDYAGGGGPGGYYHGQSGADYGYGPYYDGYAYPGYGWGYGYGYPRYYGYGGYGYGYGGSYYYPRYYYRPPIYRPPHNQNPGGGSNRPDGKPPWRDPQGRTREEGKVMIPPRSQHVPQSSQDRHMPPPMTRPMPQRPRSDGAPWRSAPNRPAMQQRSWNGGEARGAPPPVSRSAPARSAPPAARSAPPRAAPVRAAPPPARPAPARVGRPVVREP